jgi:hypothetical protein
MVDFSCPHAASQFWIALVFPAAKQRLETRLRKKKLEKAPTFVS